MADKIDPNENFNFVRLGKFRRPFRHRREKSQIIQFMKSDSVESESSTAEESFPMEKNSPTISGQRLQNCYEVLTDYNLEDDYIIRYFQDVKLKCTRQIITDFGEKFINIIRHLEAKRKLLTISLSILESTETINAFHHI